VQRVGYRDEVERIARKLRLSGFVENIKPYDVRIVAEGEADIISRFIEQIRIKKYPIDVEDIAVNFEDVKTFIVDKFSQWKLFSSILQTT